MLVYCDGIIAVFVMSFPLVQASDVSTDSRELELGACPLVQACSQQLVTLLCIL